MRNAPSQTAEAVAFFRAMEQSTPADRRVVDDPWAWIFLSPWMRLALAGWRAGAPLATRLRWTPGLAAWVLVRHRFIDDCLARSLREGAEQVVLLGAGYDMRAYRFCEQLGTRPFFELDSPFTSRRKIDRLRRYRASLPPARPIHVPIDFRTESPKETLLAAGFRQNVRTFFVWEGVSMYLTRHAVKETLTRVAELGGSGSELAMDFWMLPDDPGWRGSTKRFAASFLALLGEPVTFGLHPEDCPPFLERAGYRLDALADAPTLERRYVKDGRHVDPIGYLIHGVVS